MYNVKRFVKWANIVFWVGLVGLFVLPLYLIDSSGEMDFEQILYVMVSKGDGANYTMFFDYLWFGLPYFIGFGLLFWVGYTLTKKQPKLSFEMFGKKIEKVVTFKPTLKKAVLSALAAVLALGSFANYKLNIWGYVSERLNPGSLYETYYVDPNDVSIQFPQEKQNLIYIVLESMNTNFTSIEIDDEIVNLIPNLEKLANDNINFSSSYGFGGHVHARGLTWTAASLVGQTSGVPLQIPITSEPTSFGMNGEYLPGLTTLGEILQDNGYLNYFFMGSNADFAGRRQYFETHGNYEIYDLSYMKEIGYIPEDYDVFWGMEDSKMFDYAKERILEIASNDEPFNVTMLTVDSHFMDGYTDASCKTEYSVDYANAFACSDSMVREFVTWIQNQDFYKDTTVILVGDHNSMNNDFMQRTTSDQYAIYNAFLNVNREVDETRIKNRDYTVIDLFPTTLSALGATIEGDVLGLGVNLFSKEETLLEQLGTDLLDEELAKKSYYYENHFFKERESARTGTH